jgi:hypothetical protein
MVWLVARPAMLAAYHYNHWVIAATHLFVLGWILTVAMGAVYQLVPVALETRLYSERLAWWQFAFHVVGFIGMVWMFRNSNLKHVGHFGSVLTVGVGLFVFNIVRTLRRAPKWNITATAICAALFWICAAVAAGLSIAAAKCTYEMATADSATASVGALLRGLRSLAGFVGHFDAISAMHAHAHLGAVGCFTMLIVGVSYKLIPMFTLSEVQSTRRAALGIALLNIGSRPARRFGARSLGDLRAIPFVFAWSQNRHAVTGWYGTGSGIASFLDVRKGRGEALLRRMFTESRLFRLIIGEVEKTLCLVDLKIAREYAGLVADVAKRDAIFALIEQEFMLTRDMVLRISQEREIGERFPSYRARLAHRLPTINQVNRDQVELLRRFRACETDEAMEAYKSNLLLSIRVP